MIPEGSNPVEALSSAPIPETLWHYTSLNALKGIVEERRIWATDIRFLNDRKEYRHALELVEAEAEKITIELAKSLILDSVRESVSTGALSPSSIQLFVVSFSDAKDRLSQWRAYTEDCRGVSMGFDLRGYRTVLNRDTSASFGPCIYDDNRKRELISYVMNHTLAEVSRIETELEQESQRLAFQTFKTTSEEAEATINNHFEVMTNNLNERLQAAVTKTIWDLARIMPFLKHSSFEEEREWRLVLPMDSMKVTDGLTRKMRVGKSSLIPYIEMPVGQSASSPLTHVMVGPTPLMERAMSAVGLLLEWHSDWVPTGTVKIEQSDTSFRSW